jgi:hypothetical protein
MQNSDVYYAAGFNGQIMLINETKNVIIIRLGKDRGGGRLVSDHEEIVRIGLKSTIKNS